MKNIPENLQFKHPLSRLRLAVAGVLFFAAAALATTAAIMRVHLPWGSPTITVGANPQGIVIEPGTNTIYVANIGDNTISVIDSTKCNASNTSNCVPLAT